MQSFSPQHSSHQGGITPSGGHFSSQQIAQQSNQPINEEQIQKLLIDLNEKSTELFQNKLNEKVLTSMWLSFRMTGNSYEGKIQRKVFKDILSKIMSEKDDNIITLLFERFKLESFLMRKEEHILNLQKNKEKKEREMIQLFEAPVLADQEKIDIQDIMISLTILARLSTDDKLRLIFKWVDEDEDQCLSFDQLLQMFIRIEKNFAQENSLSRIQSNVLLNQLAYNRAQRKFEWAILNCKLPQAVASNQNNQNNQENSETQNIGQSQKDGNGDVSTEGLITYDDYFELLKEKPQLKKQLLPDNIKLIQVLHNYSFAEPIYSISDANKDHFDDFRKEFHLKLQGQMQAQAMKSKDDKDDSSCFFLQREKGLLNSNSLNYLKINDQKGVLKLPGKVETVTTLRLLKQKDIQNTFVFNTAQRFKPQSLAYEKQRDIEQREKQKEEDQMKILQPFASNISQKGGAGAMKNVQDTNSLAKHRERLQKMEDSSKNKEFDLHKDLYKNYKMQMQKSGKQNRISDNNNNSISKSPTKQKAT